MSELLVTLVNPNFVHPGVTPYALDILCSHLEGAGFSVDVLDLTFKRNDWQLAEYFASHSPVLVGVTIRNAGSVQPQEQRVFLPDHLEVIEAIRAQTSAPIVVGGAGFSTMPYAALEYFKVPYGVKGPGEIIICDLADALAAGRPADTVAGLFRYDGATVRTTTGHPRAGATLGRHIPARYERRSGAAYKVDNREYYDRGGLGNILTKNGCPFTCNHCVEPDAKGSSVSRRGAAAVADELESLVAQGIYDIHTSDSEFNLMPVHGKGVLREIIARRNSPDSPLRKLRLWIYAHPVPFDEEFADLLAEAGCKGVSLSAEHMCREGIAVWNGPSSRAGLRLHRRGRMAGHENAVRSGDHYYHRTTARAAR